MPANKLPRIALVWTQFIPTHVDRIIAVSQRLEGKARVCAVEVASTSETYFSFAPTGEIPKVERRTLFPGRSFDAIAPIRRFWALLRNLAGARIVCIGIPYSAVEVLLLTLVLRLMGTRVFMVYDSKFDDKPRSAWFEAIKRTGLACFSGAIVAGARTCEYLRFLGFAKRPILGGADGISIDRIRADARAAAAPVPDFSDRDFVYVGRFVEVKNLELLIDAYAAYAAPLGPQARRLVLVGEGHLEASLRERAARLGLADKVVFAGFKAGPDLAAILSGALGLVLFSSSEPWGLVVNEAMALGLPLLLSEAPGSRDVLVRNFVNGFVIETGSGEGMAGAMTCLGGDEARWAAMSQASLDRAWLGDSERFADAVELLHDPAAQPAGEQMNRYLATFQEALGNQRICQFSV